MLRVITIFSVLLGLAACNADHQSRQLEIDPDAYMDEQAQQEFLYSISRYTSKYPSKADEINKWESRFDAAYAEKASRQKLTFFYHDSTSGTTYYLLSAIAPSIHEKYVGYAGKFQPTEEDPLHGYVEVFRTWKMFPDEHREKSEMLFRKMIQGEDLTPYYTANSGGAEYIEFPDSETWYDAEARIWRSERDGLLDPYKPKRKDSK